jgi:hypothetical protein
VDRRGFGVYRAADYDELADCPVEMGDFWSAEFSACGVVHRFVVAGALPSFDQERLLRDTQKICETAIRFWHGAAALAALRASAATWFDSTLMSAAIAPATFAMSFALRLKIRFARSSRLTITPNV